MFPRIKIVGISLHVPCDELVFTIPDSNFDFFLRPLKRWPSNLVWRRSWQTPGVHLLKVPLRKTALKQWLTYSRNLLPPECKLKRSFACIWCDKNWENHSRNAINLKKLTFPSMFKTQTFCSFFPVIHNQIITMLQITVLTWCSVPVMLAVSIKNCGQGLWTTCHW